MLKGLDLTTLVQNVTQTPYKFIDSDEFAVNYGLKFWKLNIINPHYDEIKII